MKTLDRYIIKELIPPFFCGLVVVMFVLLIDFILDVLNLIIAKGVPVFVVGKLFSYSLAWMFSLAVPMAVLVSSLMAFGRLAGDKELIAAKALGIPFWRMMLPAGLTMMLLSVVMVIFGDLVLPESNKHARTLMVQIHKKKPLAALYPRIFISDFPNIILYMDQVDDKAGKIFGVRMYEKREGFSPRIIIAPEGEVKYDAQEDAISFTLFNGEIHDIDTDDPSRYTRGQFEKQVINIGNLGTQLGGETSQQRGDREFSIDMLKTQIGEYQSKIDSLHGLICKAVEKAIDSVFAVRHYDKPPVAKPERRALLTQRKVSAYIAGFKTAIADSARRMKKLEVELQKKYSLPLACLVFFLIGAPVGAWARRGGIGMAAGLSFGFFLIYWAFLIGGEEIADRGLVSPTVGMWSGNVVMAIAGLLMLYRVTYESRFAGFGWLSRFLVKRVRNQSES